MKFALLASGSKGNCCLVKHKDTKIMIDCGTTGKYLKTSFEKLRYDPLATDALLVTHTHKDHVSQMKLFDRLPTYAASPLVTDRLTTVTPYDMLHINDLKITVLPMSHDCEGTVGFAIESEDEKMVYITDTGYIKEEVKAYIQDADYYVFESNHDVEMLMQTNRPVYIKQRIINDYGHLCNEDSANILSEIICEKKTKEIVLAHISQEGNSREKALKTLQKTLCRKQVNYEHMKLFAADQFSIYIGGKK